MVFFASFSCCGEWFRRVLGFCHEEGFDAIVNMCMSEMKQNTHKESLDCVLGNSVNGGSKPAFFASIFNDTTSKTTIRISELSTDENVECANVAILLAAVDEVSHRFANTLFGYFIGKHITFPIVENYVKNTWPKYGIERVMWNNCFSFFHLSTMEGMEQV